MNPSTYKTRRLYTVVVGDGRRFTLEADGSFHAIDVVSMALGHDLHYGASRAKPGEVINWPPVDNPVK